MSAPAPEIAVAVPSHDRPLRLRWLLNALEEQTLPRERFEVVVASDSSGPETAELLAGHPLAAAGVLRHVALPPGSAPPGANRNAAWRLARAPVIAFTDDDCRPPADWLVRALEAARANPGAVVQGRTQAEPLEVHLMGAPHARTQAIDPPSPFAQACNIVYPLELLERLGGFDEHMLTGEDAELALRAQEAGVAYVGDASVLTFHAVDTPTLLGRLRSSWRWRDLPALVKRHPSHRSVYPLGAFWKWRHALLPPALAGLLLRRRSPAALLLVLPWAVSAAPDYQGTARGYLRVAAELPGRAAIDAAEMAALAAGSVRHRTFFL